MGAFWRLGKYCMSLKLVQVHCNNDTSFRLANFTHNTKQWIDKQPLAPKAQLNNLTLLEKQGRIFDLLGDYFTDEVIYFNVFCIADELRIF